MVQQDKINYVVAIDPGPTKSALVLLNLKREIIFRAYDHNDTARKSLSGWQMPGTVMVIERMQSMGMAVGASVFETCYNIGRFVEMWPLDSYLVSRGQVKMEICGSMRAKDPNIRQAMMDLYGGERRACIGTKKQPGKLYGIAGDLWSALAIGNAFINFMGRGEHYEYIYQQANDACRVNPIN